MTDKSQEKPLEDDLVDQATQVERNIQLETVYKRMIPHIGDHSGKLLTAHIILILKLEGIIGKELNETDIEMVEGIKEKLINTKSLRNEAMDTIKKIMGTG